MSKSGRRIAVVDWGYNVGYVGPIELIRGWKTLLRPLGWEVDFFYLEERCNRRKMAGSSLPFPIREWTEVSQVEGYDFVIFNRMGKSAKRVAGGVTDKLVDRVLQLRNPICIYVDHDRAPIPGRFRNVSRKPQYVYAFDYVLTHLPLRVYREGGVPPERVRNISLWHHWRGARDDVILRPMVERPTTVSYAAYTNPRKGVFEAYDFFGEIRRADPDATFVMYGWVGAIWEVKVKEHPFNIMDIRKDGVLEYNSPEAFVRFHRFTPDQRVVYQVVADSRYSWCVRMLGKGSKEKWTTVTLEGAPLTALRCHTVPIVNDISRKLDVLGTPLEDYGVFLFTNRNDDTARLTEEFLSLDHEKRYQGVVEFERMFFDPDRFRRAITGTLEELLLTGHQPRCKPAEVKFNQIDPARDILAEHQDGHLHLVGNVV